MPPEPLLSVIIPTRNRSERLAHTLDTIARQEKPDLFEVVVVNNGSTDDTADVIARAAANTDITLTHVDEPKVGVGSATNSGVREARGKYILRLGDDTTPQRSDLFAEHLSLHEEQRDERFAVLGRIVWAGLANQSEFMRWLDSGGPQFHYHEISAGWVAPRNYFYGSHVSLSKAALLEVGGFDERFVESLDDIELGYRLEEWGLQLEYHPELVVEHDHPRDLDSSIDRIEQVGRYSSLFNSIGPAGRHERVGVPSATQRFLASPVARVTRYLDRLPLPDDLQRKVWRLAHTSRFTLGYKQGPPERLG